MEKTEFVKIAPEMGEIKFDEKRESMYCSLNGQKITYKLPPGVVFSNDDDRHKKAFQSVIALSSKMWQIEGSMNKVYGVQGEVKIEKIVEA